MSTYLENFASVNNGLTLVQVNPHCAVQLTIGLKDYGWMYIKGSDGQWVTLRKLNHDEIETAHDQAASGLVLNGTKIRVA